MHVQSAERDRRVENHAPPQLGVHIETLVFVTGLADDHAAARAALTAAAKLALSPAAVVMEPAMRPTLGFELLVATPEPVSPAALAKLRQALVAELHQREVMATELAVELLNEAEA